MLGGLVHTHSGFRWIVLILLVYATLNAFLKWRGKKNFTESDRKVNLFTTIFSHVQMLLGIGLFFMSSKVNFSSGFMKDAILRFFTVEHTLLMLIAILLITLGYSKSKKVVTDSKKLKTTFWYFFIALVLILVSIPWPWRALGAEWF